MKHEVAVMLVMILMLYMTLLYHYLWYKGVLPGYIKKCNYGGPEINSSGFFK